MADKRVDMGVLTFCGAATGAARRPQVQADIAAFQGRNR